MMNKRQIKSAIASLWILVGIGVVFPSSSVGQKATQPVGLTNQRTYNVILIDMTCLRADHLSSSGYFRKTSPYLDRLAADGIWFKQAISPSYWTLPSVASVLTSKYPAAHNVLSRNQKLNDSFVTITEVLKREGYKTAAFVGGLDLAAVHNLNQGFDVYFDETGENPTGSFSKNFPKALSWLKENRDGKFFLYIQGYDAHPPFHYPPPFEHAFDPEYKGIVNDLHLGYEVLKNIQGHKLTLNDKEILLNKRDIDNIIAHYDGGISYVDNLLEDFMKQLQKMKLLKKTIIILYSDHGEELSDHGSFDRFGKANLYEEVVHVPFIIRHPHLKGIRIEQPVEIIDIAPTILGFLKLPPEQEMKGVNLLPLIKDEVREDPAKYVYGGWGNKQMIRTAEWKLIFDGRDFELYDIKNDPKELNNLADKKPVLEAELSGKLFHWFVATRFKGDFKNLQIPVEELPDFYKKRHKNQTQQGTP